MQDKSSIEIKYVKIQKISEGSYGIVYKARNIQTEQIVAIKKFKKLTNQGIPVGCIRQINILNILKGSSVQSSCRTLKLYQSYQKKDQIQMVIQWLDQTLSTIIQTQPYNPKSLFKQVLQSTLQLHELYIMHRDIKPPNIMRSKQNGVIKLIDYGMAKEYDFQDRPMTIEVGSLYYQPPQILLNIKHYSFPVDVWALGCIFYQILTKQKLFKGENSIDQLQKILAIIGTGSQHFQKKLLIQHVQSNWINIQKEINDQKAVALLKRILKLNPKQRPTAKQILSDEYFLQDN